MSNKRLRAVAVGAVAGLLWGGLGLFGVGRVEPGHPAASRGVGAGLRVPARLTAYSGGSAPAGVAGTSSGRGFWVASTDGTVTAEGDAPFFGDMSGPQLGSPVVSIAPTSSGGGYWLLGGDGGVFTFGNARFYGSTGGIHLNGQALQIAGTPTGNGYWFVARDGGVFTFGDARFFGSTGAMRLNQPVVGMAATGDGGGYWLVARDGGVFTFGDARFFGSGGGASLPAPVIGIVASPDDGGYWIVLGNGQVRAFGDAAVLNTAAISGTGFSLVGQVIGLDPGHNGGNGANPRFINQPVWNGRAFEACDTTGTETAAGYTEASFNFDVASRLAAALRALGATVVLTRPNNTGVGPCVNQRAAIINASGADASLDIHGDGGSVSGRGFTILEPVADGPNNAVINPSANLGADIRALFQSVAGEPVSNYYGSNGIQPRTDLAGLNLTTVPKILIECANMTNPTDAANVSNAGWRQNAAAALAAGLSRFLIGFD